VTNPDIKGRSVLVNFALEMNRSDSLVAAKRPKVPKSAQEFFNLQVRILLHGEFSVWEVAVGKISDWGR